MQKENEMKCPVCTTGMTEGRASVEGTILGFIMFGLSSQHLWFKHGKSMKKIIQSSGRKPGFICPKCGTVVIPNDNRTWLDKIAGKKL